MAQQAKEVHLGDGVIDGAVRTVNKRLSKTTNNAIEDLFDKFDANAKDIPSEIIESYQKLKDYFSQQEERKELGARAKGSNKQKPHYARELSPNDTTLPPETRVLAAYVKGFHQGKKFEYQLAMLALAENNAPKELIIAVCNYLKEKGRRWDDRDREKIEQQYNEQKYLWDE